MICVIFQSNQDTGDGMDLNGDGVVNVADINYIINIIHKN